MLADEISSHYDGEETQPNLPYVDSMVWNTNDQLPPSDVVVEGMLPPDVSSIASETNIGLTTSIRGG
jgi:hypothetical protein